MEKICKNCIFLKEVTIPNEYVFYECLKKQKTFKNRIIINYETNPNQSCNLFKNNKT